MKQVLVLLTAALLLTACSSASRKADAAAADAAARSLAARRAAISAADHPDFRAGISSATVEKLAKKQDCPDSAGASLVGEAGPVESYRMVCGDGKVIEAKCELRQCKLISK